MSAATTEEPMDTVFYMLSAPRLYNEDELDGINTVYILYMFINMFNT